MSEHTPGPWVVSDHVPNLAAVSDATGSIATVARWLSGVPGDGRENLSNACLIAAAPELLEALRRILEHCDINPEGETTFERDIQAGRAAIANAEAQSEALSHDRAEKAGRMLVAECRQAGAEVAERIRDRVRALDAEKEGAK